MSVPSCVAAAPAPARTAAGSSVGRSPCRLTTRSKRRSGSMPRSAAKIRSVPEGRAGSVSTASPPAARTASAIAGSAQATTTGPTPASRARRQTCTIIGSPAIGASGLSGSRVEPSRAGIRTTVRDEMSSPCGADRRRHIPPRAQIGRRQGAAALPRACGGGLPTRCARAQGRRPVPRSGNRRGSHPHGRVSRGQQARRGRSHRGHRRRGQRGVRRHPLPPASPRGAGLRVEAAAPAGGGERRRRPRRRRSRSASCWRRPTPTSGAKIAKKCAACHSFRQGRRQQGRPGPVGRGQPPDRLARGLQLLGRRCRARRARPGTTTTSTTSSPAPRPTRRAPR